MTLLLGLGIIGSRSADQLLAAGHSLETWNRSPKDREDLVADLEDSNADIFLSYLRDDVAVREVFEKISPQLGEGKTFINHSTIDPDTTMWLDRRCRELGCEFLDAPFTGSRDAAAGGNLVYYVAGDSEVLEKHRSLLEITSRAILYLGEAPAATVVKVTTNLVTAAAVQATTEALEISRRHGVDPRAWHEAAKLNGCYAPVIGMKVPTLLEADYTPHFSVENMLKDVNYTTQLAKSSGISITEFPLTLDRLKVAMYRHAHDDFSAINVQFSSVLGEIGYLNMSPVTVIKAEGPDSLRFLNGQISNDVALTEDGNAVDACLLNAKGQLEAYCHVLQKDGAYYLVADRSLRNTLFQRLDKYLIADDVALADLSDDFDFVYQSDNIDLEMALNFGVINTLTNSAGEPGMFSLVPREKVEFETFPYAAGTYEANRIERGIPKWPNEIFPGLLPAEAGLDETAVSFTKGCYTGQEVVSRMKRAGKTPKHLVKLTLDKPLIPTKSKLAVDGKEAGWITSVASLLDQEVQEIALGYRLRKFEDITEFDVLSPASGEVIGRAKLR